MLAAAAVVVALTNDPAAPAPPPRPTVGVTSSPLPLGTPFTLGAMFLANPDREDLEVVSVVPNVSDNVEVVGDLAVSPMPADYGGLTGASGFPPASDLAHIEFRPAAGTVFPGSQAQASDDHWAAIELLVGVRATSGPVGAVNGVTVDYRIGGDARTEYFPYALILCVAPIDCDGMDSDGVLRDLGLLADDEEWTLR